MTSLRLLLPVVAICCFFRPAPLHAQVPTFTLGKQFSADQTITTKDTTVTSKMNMDGDKIRNEMNRDGMNMIAIIRPDQKLMYILLVSQKMAMKHDYNPEEMKKRVPASAAVDGSFTLVGPDLVDAVPAIKYKMSDKASGKDIFVWVSAAQQIPLKMTDSAGTFTVVWKNYKAGPQDPSLFELPSGYNLMELPASMPMPGGQ